MNHKLKNNLTDRQMIEYVLGGDHQSFKIIIKHSEGLVAQLVFKMIYNVEERKDIVQDIYMRVFKNLSTFRYQSKLSTWIGQIAYNTCLNYINKKKNILIENYNDPDLDAEELFNKSNEPEIAAETFLFDKDVSDILTVEINKLQPLYKTLITLFHNEELSYTEIEQITDLPIGTIKNYLFRARRILKENLMKQYKREEL